MENLLSSRELDKGMESNSKIDLFKTRNNNNFLSGGFRGSPPLSAQMSGRRRYEHSIQICSRTEKEKYKHRNTSFWIEHKRAIQIEERKIRWRCLLDFDSNRSITGNFPRGVLCSVARARTGVLLWCLISISIVFLCFCWVPGGGVGEGWLNYCGSIKEMFCCKTWRNGRWTSQGGGKAHKVEAFPTSKSCKKVVTVIRCLDPLFFLSPALEFLFFQQESLYGCGSHNPAKQRDLPFTTAP